MSFCAWFLFKWWSQLSKFRLSVATRCSCTFTLAWLSVFQWRCILRCKGPDLHPKSCTYCSKTSCKCKTSYPEGMLTSVTGWLLRGPLFRSCLQLVLHRMTLLKFYRINQMALIREKQDFSHKDFQCKPEVTMLVLHLLESRDVGIFICLLEEHLARLELWQDCLAVGHPQAAVTANHHLYPRFTFRQR